MRLNCKQVKTARTMMGMRNGESKTHHHKVVAKTRQCQGKGNVWATHWHDPDKPMRTLDRSPRQQITSSWADLDIISEAELAAL